MIVASNQPTIKAEANQLSIVYVPISSLKRYRGKARKHTKAQTRKLAEAIREYGFTNPILINSDGTIIAGHARLEAAILLGLTMVPTIRLEGLTPSQVQALVLFDNRIALDAKWDTNILKLQVQQIILSGQVDISLTGFEPPEIDIVLQGETQEQKDDPDDDLPEETQETVTKAGDIWQLGKHRALCADSRDQAAVSQLMDGSHADVSFNDCPYNIPIDGNVSGKGAVKHRDFAMAVGEMSPDEFIQFLKDTLGVLAQFSTDGAVHFVCCDWRHMGEMLAAGSVVYNKLLNLCVWVKNNGGQGSFYRSRHELIFVFRCGKGQHRNNIQLGRLGRYRTNVWEHAAIRGLSQQQDEEGNLLALHPTVKPVAMVADAILDCSARGDLVLDGFLGSGSTLIAAERVGRICYGVEIDPKYVDVAVRRWQRYTGDTAVHAVTGRPFGEPVAGETTHG